MTIGRSTPTPDEERWQRPIFVGPNQNRCGDLDMTGGVRCRLLPDHDGDHDYCLHDYYNPARPPLGDTTPDPWQTDV